MPPTIPLREERTQSEPSYSSYAPQILSIALQALDERILLWAVTLGAGGVWTFTLMHPEVLRLSAACAYSVTVLWPVLWRVGRS